MLVGRFPRSLTGHLSPLVGCSLFILLWQVDGYPRDSALACPHGQGCMISEIAVPNREVVPVGGWCVCHRRLESVTAP